MHKGPASKDKPLATEGSGTVTHHVGNTAVQIRVDKPQRHRGTQVDAIIKARATSSKLTISVSYKVGQSLI